MVEQTTGATSGSGVERVTQAVMGYGLRFGEGGGRQVGVPRDIFLAEKSNRMMGARGSG